MACQPPPEVNFFICNRQSALDRVLPEQSFQTYHTRQRTARARDPVGNAECDPSWQAIRAQCRQGGLQVGWDGSFDLERLAGSGMRQFEPPGMQCLPLQHNRLIR